MPVFVYHLRPDPHAPLESDEIDAEDRDDAMRQLRIRYCRPSLPPDTVLIDKSVVEAEESRARSARLRHLLRVLHAHHEWLQDPAQGRRADLAGRNLSNLKLAGKDLRDADLTGADLTGADLTEAVLTGANLTRATLQGACLRSADLSQADLSDVDLRDADLLDAALAGVDLWRANLQGCRISPAALHAALGCREG